MPVDYGQLGTPGSYNINRYAPDQYSFLGDDYSYLRKTLKDNFAKGMPGQEQQRSLALKNINQSMGDARRTMSEQMASQGTYGSPIGLNLTNDLFGKKAKAVGELDTNLLQQNTAYKNAILSQLQNLNAFGAGQKLNEVNSNMNLAWRDKAFKEQQRQYNQSNEGDFWTDIFPSLLEMGGKIGAAALTGGTSEIANAGMNNYNDIFGIK